MAPQQHLVISWVISNLVNGSRRERIIITLCGLIPDIDGVGLFIDRLRRDGGYTYFLSWHHKAAHNIFAMLAIIIIGYLICKRKLLAAAICGSVFLCHVVCDFIGSGGEEGDIWKILPFWPTSSFEWAPRWQWSLNDWRNTLITGIFLLIAAIIAAKKNRSFLEVFSVKMDQYCIKAVREVFSKMLRKGTPFSAKAVNDQPSR